MQSFYQPTSAINFSNLTMADNNIKELYRRFENVYPDMFSLPTLFFGIFGRVYPNILTIEDLELHKKTNITGSFYLVSLTKNKEYVSAYQQSFVVVDSILFQNYIVDLDQSFHKNQRMFPGRMIVEQEFVSLICLYPSIKSFVISGQEIQNPFYISSEKLDQRGHAAFTQLYEKLIIFLRKIYRDEITAAEKICLLKNFVNEYLAFYAAYSANDPFRMDQKQFQKLFPEYAKNFLAVNGAFDSSTNLKFFNQCKFLDDVARENVVELFENHPYVSSIKQAQEDQKHPEQFQQCTEDDYARPVYD